MSLRLRPAVSSDLDSLTSIAIAAFPFDPQWPYRYPNAEKAPEEHWRYVRLTFEEYMERVKAGVNTIMVVEASEKRVGAITADVIALSVWDNVSASQDGIAVAPVTNHFEREDANAARMRAYLAATMAFRQDVFIAEYGPRQISLRMMATHPEYWRKGAGRLAMQWGVDEADRQKVAVVMFASPLGKHLYERYGFHELGVVTVRVEGDDETLHVSGMARDLIDSEAASMIDHPHEGHDGQKLLEPTEVRTVFSWCLVS